MRWFIGALIGCVGFYWLYTTFIYPSGALRYRMTVQAVSEGKLVSGSGVIEVIYTTQPGIAASAVTSRVRGEAIRLDFGSQGQLFLLLIGYHDKERTGDPHIFAIREFGVASSESSLSPEILRSLSTLKANANVPFSRLPQMIRLRDSQDPRTVEVVRYDEFFRHFSDTRLLSVTIETTDDPVTREIEEILPWLSSESSLRELFSALRQSGFRSNGSIEIRSLFTQGGWHDYIQ